MKYAKVSGCNHCPYCYYDEGNLCTYNPKESYSCGLMPFPINNVREFNTNKTIHPDCPLDDYEG